MNEKIRNFDRFSIKLLAETAKHKSPMLINLITIVKSISDDLLTLSIHPESETKIIKKIKLNIIKLSSLIDLDDNQYTQFWTKLLMNEINKL